MDKPKVVAIRVEMPDELRNKFKSAVARDGKNMKDVVLSFVREYVAQHESSKNNKEVA